MKETWKIIKGYVDYQISTKGRVNSMKHFNCKILKQSKNKGGYYHVNLYENKIKKNIDIHRLVAQAFIPNPDNKPCVNHIDGNKQNNHIDNLEWVTCLENHKHAWKIGLKNSKHNQGIKHYFSKLTENEVLTIHGLYLSGMKQKQIAKTYNINQQNVSSIINGISWKHII